jgi:hypothetical protein
MLHSDAMQHIRLDYNNTENCMEIKFLKNWQF